MTQPHPLLGRSLNEYAAFYGHNFSRRGVSGSLIPDHLSTIRGREALSKMHKCKGVTLEVLQSVLRLAFSPATLRDFNNPFLIHACLTLIDKLKSLTKLPVSFLNSLE